MAPRPPVPPFSLEDALTKVKSAENAWNAQKPEQIAMAYTEDSEWRNRTEHIKGRAAIVDFLQRKWQKELDYRLEKYLWCMSENRIAVHFQYEYHDSAGQWWRCYGNENWEFDEEGYMAKRVMQGNNVRIQESERKFRWTKEERAAVPLAEREFSFHEGTEAFY